MNKLKRSFKKKGMSSKEKVDFQQKRNDYLDRLRQLEADNNIIYKR